MFTIRRAGLVLGVILVLGVGVAQAGLEDGLVSYWPFDGAVTDVHGGQVSTLTGGTEHYAPAKFGQGIQLDGNNEQVDVTETGAYDFGAAGNGMSISVWTKVDAFDRSWQALIAKGEGNEFRLHREGGSDNMNWSANGDTTAGYNVNDGALHHIVATHDGADSNSTKELWIDGELRSSVTNGGQIGDNDEPLMIGENPDGANRNWEGIIDDVGIWGRPLTQDEILSMWNQGEGASIGDLTQPIPEPLTMLAVGLGLTGLGGYIRRRRRRA